MLLTLRTTLAHTFIVHYKNTNMGHPLLLVIDTELMTMAKYHLSFFVTLRSKTPEKCLFTSPNSAVVVLSLSLSLFSHYI